MVIAVPVIGILADSNAITAFISQPEIIDGVTGRSCIGYIYSVSLPLIG